MSREQKSAHHDLAFMDDRVGPQHAWEVLDQVFPWGNKNPQLLSAFALECICKPCGYTKCKIIKAKLFYCLDLLSWHLPNHLANCITLEKCSSASTLVSLSQIHQIN